MQQVQYSTNNVYVSATCIPSYNIGPWNGNPNTPTNQNFVYKITRNPVQNTSTASDYLTVYVQPGFQNNIRAALLNSLGQEIKVQANIQPAVQYSFDISDLPSGIYFLKLETNNICSAEKIVVTK